MYIIDGLNIIEKSKTVKVKIMMHLTIMNKLFYLIKHQILIVCVLFSEFPFVINKLSLVHFDMIDSAFK